MDALAKNRASLMAQLPASMRAAEQTARDALAGQNDMFGTASPAATKIELPEVEAWPVKQLLAGETHESLGHYLSGHPTDEWRDLITKIATCPIGEIDKHHKPPPPERQFRYSDQQSFTLVGAVMGIRKQGDSRVFVLVEDFSGKFEAIPVPRGVDRLRSVAYARCDPGFRRRRLGRRIRRRLPHAHAAHLGDAVRHARRQARLLRLRLNGIDADFARRLQGVLAGHRGGTTAVRLNVRNAGHARRDRAGRRMARACHSRALRQTLERLAGVLGAEYVFTPAGSTPDPQPGRRSTRESRQARYTSRLCRCTTVE